jgi:hypothetical protein
MLNHSVAGIAGWTAGLVVALASLGPLSSTASSRSESRGCSRVALQESPLWISDATSLGDVTSRLLVVDPYRNKLISYDPQGHATWLPDVQLGGSKEFPASVAKTETGFLLEATDGHFVSLDDQFHALRQNAPAWKSAAGERVGSLYQWTIAGDKLFGLGTLTKPDRSFQRGFLRAPVGLDGKVELLRAFANEDFYLLSGYSYVASLGDEAYFVSMDKLPAIYRATPESRDVQKLKAFPDEYRIRPDFQTRMTGPKSAAAHYAELATFTMPAGLYAQDGRLYLLTRRPGGTAKTVWWLYQIDPEKDVILGRVQLPTTADHLTVVPGERNWLVFERGPVEAIQQQKISSMLVIPSVAIHSLSLPETCSGTGK